MDDGDDVDLFINDELSYNISDSKIFMHDAPIQFNSIQFNSDICTRQLINYHVWRARRTQKT